MSSRSGISIGAEPEGPGVVGVRGDVLGSGGEGCGAEGPEGHGWAGMGPSSQLDYHGNSWKSGDPGGHDKRLPGKKEEKKGNTKQKRKHKQKERKSLAKAG